MNQDEINEILEKHKKWLSGEEGGERAKLQGADLRGANLQGENLQGADLQGADLQGADLDFSCWPLWCGSFNVKVDDRQMAQLIDHVLSVDHPLAKKLRKLKTVTSLSDLHKESKKGWSGEE